MRNILHTLLHHAKSNNLTLQDFVQDEEGATSIEYGLIVSLIFLAIIAGVQQFSGTTSEMYEEITSTMAAAGN